MLEEPTALLQDLARKVPCLLLFVIERRHVALPSLLSHSPISVTLQPPSERANTCHVYRRTQLLACLKWLGDFQVPACVPLAQEIAFQDVADLVDVPVAQLCRVVRMTATLGFMCEPRPGYVAHTLLSTQFVLRPSLLDTVMFLSDASLPAGLHMPQATRLHGSTHQAHQSAWNVGIHSQTSFSTACAHDAKLQRQSAAFMRLWAGAVEESVTDALSSLLWSSLGEASVVDAGPQSTSTALALAERAPGLRVVVQLRDDGRTKAEGASRNGAGQDASGAPSRITVQNRTTGAPQTIDDAAVYILHLPTPSLHTSSSSTVAQVTAELRAHFNLLRANAGATLIIVARISPEPGSVDAQVESVVRLQDMFLMQMANDRCLELPQLLDLLHSVRDATGRLTVVNTLSSRRHLVVVFEVKIQPEP